METHVSNARRGAPAVVVYGQRFGETGAFAGPELQTWATRPCGEN